MTESLPPGPPALPQVTLCAVTSVNVAATIRALEASMAEVNFAACKLFTDASITSYHPKITLVAIPRITSAAAYSDFVLTRLVDHIDTSHCLVVQWDGHVLDGARWRPEFLDYDYIGAVWPQFDDGRNVGNGGFSLRSRRLMEAVRATEFDKPHPEDIAIGRDKRTCLEEIGMRFAPPSLANLFSAEREGDPTTCFGYHGAWHMPRVIGVGTFWDVYRNLDARGTIWHDFAGILKQISRENGGYARALRFIADHVRR